MTQRKLDEVGPRRGDALLVIDVQRDSLPHGSPAVPAGERVLTRLTRCSKVLPDAPAADL